jgi:hypothetical protein
MAESAGHAHGPWPGVAGGHVALLLPTVQHIRGARRRGRQERFVKTFHLASLNFSEPGPVLV